MQRKLIIGALLMLMSFTAIEVTAQTYAHSAGIRAGFSSGLSYKGFRTHRLQAVEAAFYYNQYGLQASVTYNWHFQVFRNKGLQLYAGGGPMLGTGDGFFRGGVLLTGGLEYVVRDVPLSFALDYRPGLYLFENITASWYDLGLCLRYYFK